LEPQIPDLAEAIEADFDKEKQKMEFVDFADDKENPEEDKFKKSSHSRCCRSRTMSENEKKNENLAAWFAHKGVTYQVWLSAHRDNRTVKKAWSCEHSGWKKMLQHVAAGKELTCQVPLL
jgi:cytidylate kinase